MKHVVTLAAAFALTASAALAETNGAPRAQNIVRFVVKQNFGSRAIVRALVSDVPYKFMIHSNAGAPVQMNHRWAARAKVYGLRHNGTYGISAAGQLSTLGRDEGILPLLELGAREYHDVRVSVFETPNLDNIGMLGTGWLHEADVVMDFPSRVLRLDMSARDRAKNDRRLKASGYAVIPMRYDVGTRRYVVDATIGSATRPMVVSTVAGLIVDDAFAVDAGLARGKVINELEGPAGAVLPSYQIATPAAVTLGTWTSRPTPGQIQDVYAYQSSVRPQKNVTGGMLGADFLIAHHAVIDFKRLSLYLKR